MADLVDAVWTDLQPDKPRRAIQLYITRLRTVLAEASAEALIETCADGYKINVPPESIDILRFQRLMDEARRARENTDSDREMAALRQGLGLWRGEPMADVPSDLIQRETVPPLREQRLHAIERRIDLDLASGRHSEVIGDLLTLTAQQPLRERLWEQLMIALDRAGRRSEALEAYHRLRRHLADELGVDPTDDLHTLMAAILNGHRADRSHSRPLATAPRQIPQGPPRFAGRTKELKELDTLLERLDEFPSPGSVMIATITGTAGVGKTALAAHWARRVADRFPDGQLWVNLNGYHQGRATSPGQALTRFLRALGVPGHQVPFDLDDQVGLFRSMMDGRRMLIVLDNANSAEQVRPLLPGAPGCLVVVTSRNQLAGLVAGHDAHPLTLDLFGRDEAYQLLTQRLDAERLATHKDAACRIVERCAGLPLALVIVAARAATSPKISLESLAADLDKAHTTLNAFAVDDPDIDVRTIFSWSYGVLSLGAGRMFRLLSVHPGPDISKAATANLAGVSMAEAARCMSELCDGHLVTEAVSGRYTFHDLLRSYAAELTRAIDTDSQRQKAVSNVLDYYARTAQMAAVLLNPSRPPGAVSPPAPPGSPGEDLANHEQAMAWFTAEHAILINAIEHNDGVAFDSHICRLGWGLAVFLDRRGYWKDHISVRQASLAAAKRLADDRQEALDHRLLAITYTKMGRYEDAHDHLQNALEKYATMEDLVGQGRTHLSLSILFEEQGKYFSALLHARHACDLQRAGGRPQGVARALNSIGWLYALLGDYDQALHHCDEALLMQQELVDDEGEAAIWDSLGYVHHQLGAYPRAVGCYHLALEMRRELGDLYDVADTLAHLGDTHCALGDRTTAFAVWREAMEILEGMQHPHAEALRRVMEKSDSTFPALTDLTWQLSKSIRVHQLTQ